MKYRCEVGSFCTRMVTRHITVYAQNNDEAAEKAKDKFVEIEMRLPSSSDAGTPQVDSIEEAQP